MAMDMEEWNELYPPRTPVLWTPVDAEMGAEPIETKTTGKAWYLSGCCDQPVVNIEGYPQPVWLRRVEPVVEGPPRKTHQEAFEEWWATPEAQGETPKEVAQAAWHNAILWVSRPPE